MRLKYQLFITLLVASALLVALMFAVSSFSFSRGFLRYINNAETQRVEALVPVLQQLYASEGNWDAISGNPRLLRSLLRSDRDHRRQSGEDRFTENGWNNGRNNGRNNSSNNGRNNGRLRNPPPLPASERIHLRLALTDADKNLLLGRGNVTRKTDWYPIDHDEQIVGYLGFNKLKQLDNQIDRAFERQQRKGFALAALAMVLLSSLLAAPLTSRIVKPILKLKQTVAELSDGNFDDRIATDRRDEIGDLSRDINKLGATLASNKYAQQRHFAEISHELRTPIGVMQAELEALQDGIRPLDKTAIDSLHAETLRLNRLIEDLRSLSLADAGTLDYQMQVFDLKACIDNQINRHRSSLPDFDIEFSAPAYACFINGDQQRLEQLLDNLLQNTMRYTTLPGQLKISVSTEGNQVLLVWEDTAPGVPDAALNKLFNPLFRAEESRNREFGGSGLGLSIVRKIVNAHSGRVAAHHSDLGGLRITIRFPKSEHH